MSSHRAASPTPTRPTIVATAHRRENWGTGIAGTLEGLRRIAHRRPDTHIVMIAHPNPDLTRADPRGTWGASNITISAPLAYPTMIGLLRTAALIVTDSGGLQGEATSLGVPLLVTRQCTERPEALQPGAQPPRRHRPRHYRRRS
ncbi:UDP-N-acetylglucosamine 2-epimerase [Micromonospora schwarzwaldensis]